MVGTEQDVSETPSLLKLYKQFGDRTSMHGIGRALTNCSTWKRGVWSVMFLLGLAFAVYQFVITMNDYYSYPVTTEVVLQNEIIAQFPGVTICNLNRNRKSMIDEHVHYIMYEHEYNFVSLQETLAELQHNNSKYDDSKSVHQISDMLINCWFNTYQCTKADFIQIPSTVFGACYNFKIAGNLLQYASSAGSQHGLILELNIEQDEYLPITSIAGLNVNVHPTDEYQFPEDDAILAHPGTVTSIEFKKVITHRLPAPYSTCIDASGQGSTQRNVFPNKKYMQKACMKSCFQLALYEDCGCCDVNIPCDYYDILNVDKNTITNLTVPQVDFCIDYYTYTCLTYREVDFLTGRMNCEERCPPSCDRTTYDTVVSSALWPSLPSSNVFIEYLNSRVLQNKSFADNASRELYIRSNFLRLEIFSDKLEFLEFTAHAKYDWNLLLGTIGGLLGLCLGFSLLTAMEIVEVLIDTMLYYTRRCTRRKKPVTQSRIYDNQI